MQRVLLIGTGGKTGIWYARLLLARNYLVVGYDNNADVSLPTDLLSHKNFTASDTLSLESIDLVTLTPGVPLSLPIFAQAKKKNIEVFSELEFCYSLLKEHTIIAVTGTDGKSTTVALISHLLNAINKNKTSAIACGNFGKPYSQLIVENTITENTILVTELSSYQLELSKNFKPDIALFLNLAPDHLNRYRNLQEYANAKWNIIQSLTNHQHLILDAKLLPEHNSLWKREEHPLTKSSVNTIAIAPNLKSKNFYWKDQTLFIKNSSEKKSVDIEIISLKDLNIQGAHNQFNILAAIEAVQLVQEFPIQAIRKALTSYTGLAHRFEQIKKKGDQNIYINDSKASTCQALRAALQNVSDPVILFMGGQTKGEDYSVLNPTLENRKIFLFLFGQAAAEIKSALQPNHKKIISLEENLATAFDSARAFEKEKLDTIVTYLLAPAATSWDAYSSFEERGEHFRRLVLES